MDSIHLTADSGIRSKRVATKMKDNVDPMVAPLAISLDIGLCSFFNLENEAVDGRE
jgi:hypothetical protein